MKLFFVVLTISLLICDFSCVARNDSPKIEEVFAEDQHIDKGITDSGIRLEIEFYGYWWSEEQFLNYFDADKPPPKNDYVRLKNWDASGGNDFPHPDKLDIVCKIQNEQQESRRLKIIAVTDFKVAPFDIFLKSKSEEEGEQRLEKYHWQHDQKLGKEEFLTLKANEIRDITFKDFDLEKVLNTTDEISWVWKMRVRVVIYDENGVEILQKTQILELLPGD